MGPRMPTVPLPGAQVLHIRGFSGTALLFLYLLTACYLMYGCECDTLQEAFDRLPSPKAQRVATAGGHEPVLNRCG